MTGEDIVRATRWPSLWARIARGDLARLALVTACAITLMLGVVWPWPQAPAVGLIGVAVGCWPILAEAIEDVKRRRMSMEISMLIAILAAATIAEWSTALVITAFVLAAEILEDLSMDRGRDALTDLMAFLPDTVQIRAGGATRSIPLAEVAAGQVVLVAPGERVPVDGTVLAGRSSVDQSRITGESLPVDLTVGSEIYAGSINHVGALEVRVERAGTDSSYGRIIEAVRQAQSSEPPVQRLADQLAAWLVYLALAGAAVTYMITQDLTATIAVIVVAGACGIAAGTPLAVLAAIARIARGGAFVKDGAHLEALSNVDTVVFDKTGTLTEGSPIVVGVHTGIGMDTSELLTLAASAEAYSEHPLGKAVVDYARQHDVPILPRQRLHIPAGTGRERSDR